MSTIHSLSLHLSSYSHEHYGLIHLLCASVSISTGSPTLHLSTSSRPTLVPCNLLSLFYRTIPPLSHTSSFLCDSYGVDPTHCNFMLSGLETSLDLLARSSFVATIRLILSFYWLTCFYLLPPSPLFTTHIPISSSLTIPLLPSRYTY